MVKKKINKSQTAQQKVFVGLSGGVDSAVSAAILQKEGFAVTGVFIKVWSPDFLECTWREDRRDAMRVAAHLGIPFLTLDLEKEYKREVVDYMIREYQSGRTPNPDVMCNKEIKFGAFYNFARKKGAHFIATGHYAQKIKKKEGYELQEGGDKSKEQSYFIWNITKEQLPHVLFPIGGMEKKRVRKLAEQYKLPVASKKDSQGLCFLGKVDMKEFLLHFIKEKPGAVLDKAGKVIGSHGGAAFFTVGQRHGFTITNKKSLSQPLYVEEKDTQKNTITVSETKPDDRLTGKTNLTIRDTNWLREPEQQKRYSIRFRYHQTPLKGFVEKKGEDWHIILEEPFLASLGQSAVVYHGNTLLGGGVIHS